MDKQREEFETWWRSNQLKTFPKDYEPSMLANWGADYKRHAWLAWKAAQPAPDHLPEAGNMVQQPARAQPSQAREFYQAICKAHEFLKPPTGPLGIAAAIGALGSAINAKQPSQAVELSQQEAEALAHRRASKYAHRSDSSYVAYTFLPHTLMDFVRDVTAAINAKEQPNG